MAEFLTTTGVSDRLEQIIKNAEQRLFIISPYIRANARIKELIADKARSEVAVYVIYGKKDLRSDEKAWLESMPSVEIRFRENLHAKCYMNEKDALLTSMNLYDFSQVNNDEMGILVSREKEPELYNDVLAESERIAKHSKLIQEGAKPKSVAKGKERGAVKAPPGGRPGRHQSTTGVPTYGFCIRCKVDLRAKPTQPYCNGCYTSWNRYKNGECEEKHCHTCGNEHVTTLLKPLCVACYRKYKDVFEFATG